MKSLKHIHLDKPSIWSNEKKYSYAKQFLMSILWFSYKLNSEIKFPNPNPLPAIDNVAF